MAARSGIDAFTHSALQPATGTFSDAEVEGLPEPVRGMFSASIAPGTPLATTARISMRGKLRLRRWMAFRAVEVIAPHTGFVWAARLAAGAISGYDRYAAGEGEMRWKLLGFVPVIRASGFDVNRSAAGRVAGEAAWVPTALLPRFGVEWEDVDDRHLTARLVLDSYEMTFHYLLEESARIHTCWFERWGDPDGTGTFGLHPFAMEASAHRTFDGVTIPSAGHAGWHYGTERWEDGIFFRYEITELELLSATA